uniref:Small ribosomal subunit protein eS4 n=1 Tax=Ceriodaphnia reticulata TaxID=302197 RepID=A0A4Y7LZU2_9CRUS|nr:EOG090X0615 [Ceriodaphnia reticulata]
MANTLYIPVTNGSTSLNGLVTLFVNNWSGNKTLLTLVDRSSDSDSPTFPIESALVAQEVDSDLVSLTTLPLLVMGERENISRLLVSGLAAVSRHVIKESDDPAARKALGFRGNCLQAPAECSIWTSFCEVQMIQSTILFLLQSPVDVVEIPAALVKFEEHLKQPIRMHNIVKRWQDEEVLQPTAEQPHQKEIQKLAATWLDHTFAEGPDMTLADLLLFPCVTILANRLSVLGIQLADHLPRVGRWLASMKPLVEQAWRTTASETPLDLGSLRIGLQPTVKVPRVKESSLYKKDASRPGVGSRLDRKIQQLDGMAAAVIDTVSEGDVVVDFCSGGGHLGILLAYLLPRCHLIMVDNKEESVRHARSRVALLKLTNVTIIQSNLDYFRGRFDLGIALHACGVATDLARGPKKHLKRLAAPKSWMLDKLGGVFAPRPSTGPHKLRESLPMVVFLRNRLKYALNNSEVTKIVMQRLIKVDGKVRTDANYPAGFMDVITIDKTGEYFRLVYDVKGRFAIHRITAEEAKYKLCKVRRVQVGPKGIPFITTHDGRTIRYPDPLVKVNDTIQLDIASNKIMDFIKFDSGNLCMITGGRNLGRVGTIINRERHPGSFDIVHVKDALGHTFATRLNNVFIIGKGSKAYISLPRDKGVKLSISEERNKRLAAKAAA